MGTFSIWHWLVVLLVVVLVFGSGKLAKAGPDLGEAIRGFKDSMRGGGKKGGAKTAKDATALEARETNPNAKAAKKKKASS